MMMCFPANDTISYLNGDFSSIEYRVYGIYGNYTESCGISSYNKIPVCSQISGYTVTGSTKWEQIVKDNVTPFVLPKTVNGRKTTSFVISGQDPNMEGLRAASGKMLWIYSDGSFDLADFDLHTFSYNSGGSIKFPSMYIDFSVSPNVYYYDDTTDLPFKDDSELLGGILIVTSYRVDN